GYVFQAQVVDEPTKVVALKKCHVTDHVHHPRLLHEACALALLQGHKSIPLVYAWGRSQFYEYLAMELLGVDLGTIKGIVTLRNVEALSVQLVFIHSRGLVHCDIKPDNFMLGTAERSPGHVRLIDFGLCRPYRDSVTHEHLPDKGVPHTLGTTAYVSLNGHLHHTPSRRDDLESLSYNLLALLLGHLPWVPDRSQRRLSRRRTISLKQQWTGAKLQDSLSVFGEFVHYARSLAFTETPEYSRWRERFRALAPDAPTNILYDPSDSGSPLLSTLVMNVDEDSHEVQDNPLSSQSSGSGGLPTSRPWPEPEGDFGGWIPDWTWELAVPLEDDELLGDESTM
ncbi:kinase-like domain-containing protein, partial [Cerioporus squamosus]